MRMCHIFVCDLSGSMMFPYNLVNGIIFGGKKLLNIKRVFLYNFVCNISHSKKNCKTYDLKCMLVFM
jgi:hypothetical protein